MPQTPVTDFVRQSKIEFLLIDDSLRIRHFSEGAAALADIPEAVVLENDIREGFPEFVGIEPELLHILTDESSSWKIRGLVRQHPNSFTFYVDIQVTKADEARGEKHLVVVLEESTERMLTEQHLVQGSNEARLVLASLAESNAYLERILDSMTDALCVTTPDGIIRTVNHAALSILGYHKGELVGRHINSILSDDQLNPPDSQSVNVEPVQHKEVLWIGKSGVQIPVALSYSSVQIDQAHADGVVYLGKDLRTQKNAEAKISELRNEKEYLQEELQSKHNFQEIIGNSPPMKKVFEQIKRVAGTDSTVILLGETGTGKELIAHAIHNLSSRAKKVLIKVNCAALPSGLVESELFGHEKGAFTGAVSRKTGRFELANGGSILLDELGELELDTQVKLLRVLQEQEFERVGGTQTLKVDVRVIAATNQNLDEKVKLGAFRSDLFYRLNVFPIHIPALRERSQDIPILISYFVNKFSLKMNKRIETVETSALDALMRYRWPGNVRELANVIERAVILSDGPALKESDLTISAPLHSSTAKPTTLEEIERNHILEMLKETGGIIEGPTGAAKRLSINPSTLRSRMKKLGIQRHGTSYS